MKNLSWCDLKLSNIPLALTLMINPFHLSKASFGARLIECSKVFMAPLTLLPSPTILWKELFKVLKVTLVRFILSLALLAPSKKFLLFTSLTYVLHLSRLSFGILVTLASSVLRAPASLFPAPLILSAASLMTLLGMLNKQALSSLALMLSKNFFDLTSSRNLRHLSKASLGFL